MTNLSPEEQIEGNPREFRLKFLAEGEEFEQDDSEENFRLVGPKREVPYLGNVRLTLTRPKVVPPKDEDCDAEIEEAFIVAEGIAALQMNIHTILEKPNYYEVAVECLGAENAHKDESMGVEFAFPTGQTYKTDVDEWKFPPGDISFHTSPVNRTSFLWFQQVEGEGDTTRHAVNLLAPNDSALWRDTEVKFDFFWTHSNKWIEENDRFMDDPKQGGDN